MSGILTLALLAQDDDGKTWTSRYYLKFNEQPYCHLVILRSKKKRS